MRNVVKIGFIAFALLFISCSGDFPDSPPAYEFCKYENAKGQSQCKSIHELPARSDCSGMMGSIVDSCGN
ncbi:MAG: hypothetical protein FWC26_01580 [Fibromonadales bacterium]|nr:hypothetical protein [Fibromonadales bacterium]